MSDNDKLVIKKEKDNIMNDRREGDNDKGLDLDNEIINIENKLE